MQIPITVYICVALNVSIALSMQSSEIVCYDIVKVVYIYIGEMIRTAHFSTGCSANCLFLLNFAIKVEVPLPPPIPAVVTV